MTHTPIEIAKLAAERLQREGIRDNARLEAELLLAHVLGLKRLDLYLQHDRPLTPDEVDRYRQALVRRLRREPLQYIVGRTEFRELTLRVDARALIPRPETEVLVGCVLDWARHRLGAETAGAETAGAGPAASDLADEGSVGAPALAAVDVGTGTGAIGLSLLKEGPFARVVLTDASASALALARENARLEGLESRVEIRPGRLFEPLAEGERFDVVVSNPPYVAERDRATLAPEVRDWEPAGALFAGDDGLAVLRPLVHGAWHWLVPGGLLALEVGAGQAETVAALIRAEQAYDAPRIERDLSGRERILLASRHIAESERKPDHG